MNVYEIVTKYPDMIIFTYKSSSGPVLFSVT